MSEPTPPNSNTPPPPPKPAPGFGKSEQIFFEVAGLSRADQPEALARLCAGDAALEREVRALLKSAGEVGRFLEQPALGAAIGQAFDQLSPADQNDIRDDLPGTQLGNFRIEKRLASGGMGTVYLASRADAQFEQRVAIKVVKRGMDTEEIVRRFREERQTLAQLDHPHIARLLDGGVTPDGRPYLVMEYVEGLPIDVYCDRRRLSTVDRLKLFRLVCEGVHAAHQSLVIHRDLKPSNILVTASGIPKLLDFGIAKVLTGTTTHTAADERRLTPEYASPEQIEGGAITTSSDVYSLGVILYELLTGFRPYSFSLRNAEEVRRIVCGMVPIPPSEAIPAKPARTKTSRAKTAGRTPDPLYPNTPSPVGTASPSTLAAASGTRDTIDHTKSHGTTSTRLRNQLRGDIDTIVMMALRKEASRRYASAEQMAADIGRYLSGMPVYARRDTWLYRSRKFIRRHSGAVIAGTVAVGILSGGLVIRTQQRNEIQRQRDEIELANHRLDENRNFLISLLSGAQASDRGPSATLGDVLQDAARSLETTPPEDDLTLASTQQAVGSAMMTLGMVQQARPLLEAAVAKYKSESPTNHIRIAAEAELAQLLYYEGKFAEAEPQLRDLLTRERAHNLGQETAREGNILNALGAVLRQQKKFDEALTVQQQALALRGRVHGERSLPCAESLNNIASIHLSAGRFSDAVTNFRKSMDIRNALLRPGHPMILATATNLGLATLRAGDAKSAIPLLRLAADGWEAAYGHEHPGYATSRTALGQALRKDAQFDESLVVFRAALKWQREHQTGNTTAILATNANIGITLSEHGTCAEAITSLEAVKSNPDFPKLSPNLSRQTLEALANAYDRCDRKPEAAALRQTLAPSPATPAPK